MDKSRKPSATSPASTKKNYLIGYNLLNAVLWASVVGRVVLITSMVGYRDLYKGTGNFVRFTQTLALLEVVHSALGRFRTLFLWQLPTQA